MNFLAVFSGTHSVVRIGALWRAAILTIALFSEHSIAADRTCQIALRTGKDAVDLDACRPAPAGADEKIILLKSLPAGGEVTDLTETERRKLKDLDPLLRLHGREGVYDLKVISVPRRGWACTGELFF
jgi:hypothetical protein